MNRTRWTKSKDGSLNYIQSRDQNAQHTKDWAEKNNLRPNCAKTKEIAFRVEGKSCYAAQIPTPSVLIERMSSLTVLGVVINDQMTASDHVSGILTSCSRLLYALRVLRFHAIQAESMDDVFKSTVVAEIKYAYTGRVKYVSFADFSERV